MFAKIISRSTLFSDQIENNESLREELDDIVGGLQSYLASVQSKAQKKEKEFDQILKENESMQDRIRGLETELGVMDSEARNHSAMEKVLHLIFNPFRSGYLQTAGLPQALEIMENLENHKKKSSMHGKIMEFDKT